MIKYLLVALGLTIFTGIAAAQTPTATVQADFCEDAEVISSLPYDLTLSNTGASPSGQGGDPGSPGVCRGNNSRTLWWAWTAPSSVPANTTYILQLCGSSLDTVLTLNYSSDNTCGGTWTQQACNDDSCSTQSLISFLPTPNLPYYIVASSYSSGGQGNFRLRLEEATFTPTPTPTNTYTPTNTRTHTPTWTPTPTFTASPTGTITPTLVCDPPYTPQHSEGYATSIDSKWSGLGISLKGNAIGAPDGLYAVVGGGLMDLDQGMYARFSWINLPSDAIIKGIECDVKGYGLYNIEYPAGTPRPNGGNIEVLTLVGADGNLMSNDRITTPTPLYQYPEWNRAGGMNDPWPLSTPGSVSPATLNDPDFGCINAYRPCFSNCTTWRDSVKLDIWYCALAPTATVTPIYTYTFSPTPTFTRTFTPSVTPTRTNTATPTATNTFVPIVVGTSTPTPACMGIGQPTCTPTPKIECASPSPTPAGYPGICCHCPLGASMCANPQGLTCPEGCTAMNGYVCAVVTPTATP